MKINFFLTRPNSDKITVENGTLFYGGQVYDACSFLLDNDSIRPEEIFIPLHPSLADVCFAYLADLLAKGNKLPRATKQLCDFLSALPKREIPFDRTSVDTLPIMHRYLVSLIKDENDASRALDILFSILRQFMMDMLLFEELDPALQPVSAKVPVAQAVKTDAEQALDAFINDSLVGNECTASLPMPDGSILTRRVLILNSPKCKCAELFAALCGFSLLITTCDGTSSYHALDCDAEAIRSLLVSRGATVSVNENRLDTVFDPSVFLPLLENIDCKGCKMILTAQIKASHGLRRNKFPMELAGLTVDLCKKGGDWILTVTNQGFVNGTQFFYALKQALKARTELLNADISELLGASITLKNKTCDLFIDLPVDCMQDFYPDSIKSEGGSFALCSDGIISIWDKYPPANEMRNILKQISALEYDILRDPLHAVRVMKKATVLKISISSGKGFIKAALTGSGADKRIENILSSARASAELITVRRSLAVIISLSAFIALVLCAFPYVTGFLTPSLPFLLPTVIAAAVIFTVLMVVFTKISNKKKIKKENGEN